MLSSQLLFDRNSFQSIFLEMIDQSAPIDHFSKSQFFIPDNFLISSHFISCKEFLVGSVVSFEFGLFPEKSVVVNRGEFRMNVFSVDSRIVSIGEV